MKKVSIYLGMTFEDMYSEREFLYTEVFPELKTWCREHHLELEIIDPGYDLTEEECRNNKEALITSLRGIDRARPFYLGFFGQHRGFIPQRDEITREVLTNYPGLLDEIGKRSFQELGAMHAVMSPFDRRMKPANRCLIYARDDEYLRDALRFQPLLKHIYTNEPKKRGFFSRENKLNTEESERFLDELDAKFPVVHYTARFDESLTTPGLSNYDGKDLSAGGLTDFRIPAQFGAENSEDGSVVDQIIPPQSLKTHLLEQLKMRIRAEHMRRKSARPAATPEKEGEIYLDTMRQMSTVERATLTNLGGMERELYRKIVVQELKQASDTSDFVRTAESVYGNTEVTAFEGMFLRLMQETEGTWFKELLGFIGYCEDGVRKERLGHLRASLTHAKTEPELPEESRKTLNYLSDYISMDTDRYKALYPECAEAARNLMRSEAKEYHRVLTEEYLALCMPVGDDLKTCQFDGYDTEAFGHITEHIAQVYPEALENMLSNPFFIRKKAKLCGIDQVIADYDRIKSSPDWEEFKNLSRMLKLSREVLARDADQLYVQLLLKRGKEEHPKIEEMIRLLKGDLSHPRLIPVQNYGENTDSPLQNHYRINVAEFSQAVFWNTALVAVNGSLVTAYDKVTGKVKSSKLLPIKRPILRACGSGLLVTGALNESIWSFSQDARDLSELLPPFDAAGKGPVFLYPSGGSLETASVMEESHVVILDASTGEKKQDIPFEGKILLLAADTTCYCVAQGDTLQEIGIYEQNTNRMLGRTSLKDPLRAKAVTDGEFVLVYSPEEALVFSQKSGELLSRLVPEEGQTNLGAYRAMLMTPEGLFVSRDQGYVEVYDRSSFTLRERLKLHDEPVVSLSANKAYLYSVDTGGDVMIWDRSRLSSKENPGETDGNLIRDIYQANGSLYTFCYSHSAALSPVNLKVRKRGVRVTHYNPEVRMRKYLLHWYLEPLTVMLFNLETLQNDYECKIAPPEGFTAQDLVQAYWRNTSTYLLFRRNDGATAVAVLDMNTDTISETIVSTDYRRDVSLQMGKELVWFFAAELKKEHYSFPGKCWCELRELHDENAQFFLPMEKDVKILDSFLDGYHLVFLRRSPKGLEMVHCDVSDWIREPVNPRIEKKTPTQVHWIQDGEIERIHVQNGNVLYRYDDGSMILYRYEEDQVYPMGSWEKGRILSCHLTRGSYFLAREGGVLEYQVYDDPTTECRAYLGTEIRKILGTGAGLVSVWTMEDEIISFQMEKARKE